MTVEASIDQRSTPAPAHQAELAVASRDWYQSALNKQNTAAITTEIAADQVFFRAEEYHQQYLARPGSRPYCSADAKWCLARRLRRCKLQAS
jgi:peptide methionine sulfoxide reductase MsrA